MAKKRRGRSVLRLQFPSVYVLVGRGGKLVESIPTPDGPMFPVFTADGLASGCVESYELVGARPTRVQTPAVLRGLLQAVRQTGVAYVVVFSPKTGEGPAGQVFAIENALRDLSGR